MTPKTMIKFEMMVAEEMATAWINALQELITATPFEFLGVVSSRPATEEEVALYFDLDGPDE